MYMMVRFSRCHQVLPVVVKVPLHGYGRPCLNSYGGRLEGMVFVDGQATTQMEIQNWRTISV